MYEPDLSLSDRAFRLDDISTNRAWTWRKPLSHIIRKTNRGRHENNLLAL